MKEALDEQSRLGLIHYRLERADEAMEEALIMADSSHYNAAVNRLYYACFYPYSKHTLSILISKPRSSLEYGYTLGINAEP